MLAGRRRALGEDHPETLASCSNVGFLLHRLGRFEEALGYYEAALAARTRVLGPDDALTLVSVRPVADVLLELGRPREALVLVEDALERADGASLPGDVVRELEESLASCEEALRDPED